jgi:hypothetical protein
MSLITSNFNVIVQAPFDAATHAFAQIDQWSVAELSPRAIDAAGDRQIHFGEHVQFLVIKAERLQRRVADSRQVGDDVWHLQCLDLDRHAKIVSQHWRGPCRRSLSSDRAPHRAVADNWKPAGLNHSEETRLPRRLLGPVEPRRAQTRH